MAVEAIHCNRNSNNIDHPASTDAINLNLRGEHADSPSVKDTSKVPEPKGTPKKLQTDAPKLLRWSPLDFCFWIGLLLLMRMVWIEYQALCPPSAADYLFLSRLPTWDTLSILLLFIIIIQLPWTDSFLGPCGKLNTAILDSVANQALLF